MKAMLLAAGKGSRLKPLTEKLPKVMLKVGDKPLLEHNLNLLNNFGVEEIFINLHHLPELIVDYFGSGRELGIKITYSREKEILGSAGAVKKIEGSLNNVFFVIYGDNLSNCNLEKLLAEHKRNRGIATIAVFDMTKNKNSGIGTGRVIFDKSTNVITDFLEGEEHKIKSNYVNAGIYILEPEILNYIPAGQFYDFGKELFPLLLKKGVATHVYKMPENEYLFGSDNIDCFNRTNEFYKKLTSQI